MSDYDQIFKSALGGGTQAYDEIDSPRPQRQKPPPVDPREAARMASADMNFAQRAFVGFGSGVDDLVRGTKQLFTQDREKLARLQAEERESRAFKDGLGGWGTLGNIASKALIGSGALLIPGANTVAGAAISGGGLAALEPTADGESRLQNVAIGAGLGGGLQKALGAMASASKNRVAQQTAAQASNAQRDAAIQGLIQEGYKVPPTALRDTALNRLLENLGGKAATKQQAQIENLKNTRALASRAVGLSDLTPDALRAARAKAGAEAYGPIDALPQVLWSPEYVKNMDKIANTIGGKSQSVSFMKSPEAIQLAEELGGKARFTGQEVNGLIKALREEGNQAAYKTYGQNPAARKMGKAQLASADALEGLIDQNAPGLAGQLRAGRQKIAMLHDVENAMNPATGEIAARYFGKKAAKGKPLSGDLKTIADFANALPTLAVDSAGKVPTPGVSALGPMATVAAGGVAGPKAGLLMELGQQLRAPARSIALSKKYQAMNAVPKYNTKPGVVENEILRRIAVASTPIGLLELLE